jgi:M6 family metalloprotease-like protein
MRKVANLTILILMMVVTHLVAAPHSFLPIEATQPDGSRINIYASGDEFHNWLHDGDNYTIVRNDDGAYVYAMQERGGLVPSDLLVGKDSPNLRSIVPGLNLSQDEIKAKYDRYEQMRDYSNGRSPHTGQFNNLVIFIKFSDSPDFATSMTYYQQIFNASEEGDNSMKNYFQAASYNQLNVDSFYYPEPNGDVVVAYTDIYPRSYFQPYSGSNTNGYSGDDERTQREQQLLVRAVNAVSAQIPTTLVIDGDNDGYVDNVCFIIQGQPDGWAELLWPHRWVLYAANAYIHGKQVWDFNFQLESSLNSSGASVLAHEMFHSLGAPDLYRYYDNTIDPIGGWDLMAGNRNPPQHMSVWMKYKYGEWVDNVPNITESGTYTLHPVASSSTNNIYRLNSWRTNEKYLLEYRKPHGMYDGNLPGSGLLVYRLNTRENGNANGPPDELYIYRPGGTNTVNGSLNQAHFSEQTGRTELSEATIPNGFLGNGAAGGLNLFDIGEAGDTITFKVKVSNIQLTSPHGGEVWFSGSNQEITWAARYSTGTVLLEYSSDGGQTWNEIANNVHNTGSYMWNNVPPMNDSQQMHVRITQASINHSDSNYYPFTVIDELIAPEAVYPEDQATGVPTNPLITWQEVPGADSYYFQLASDSDFVCILVNYDGLMVNSYQMNRLSAHTTYYWRVAASAPGVGHGPFTRTFTFTTGEASELPLAPRLIAPANMSTNVTIPVTFNWTRCEITTGYKLQICSNAYFSNGVIVYDDLPDIFFTVTDLEPHTTYFWRVAAKNSVGYSNYSPIFRFTTGSTDSDDPYAPVLSNALQANFPNPFKQSTSIPVSVKNANQDLSVKIFNLRGQLVRTLHQGLPAKNSLTLKWDGRDDAGRLISEGIYFCRMETGGFVETRKVLFMR